MNEQFLKGKIALVTGGFSGMGKAIATKLAGAGANVVIGSLMNTQAVKTEGEVSYLPGEQEKNEVQKSIENLGVKCLAMNLDVTSNNSVERFCEATKQQFSNIHILVNAAGITAESTIVGHSDALWNKVIDVNLNGCYRTIKRILPIMIQQKWGRIINIASTAASVGAETSGVYCASKAGVVGLSRCIALEGARHNITCNSISPGWTNTNFGRDWMTDIAEKQENRKGQEYIDAAKADNPQKRLIEPEEIAEMALFLCRDKAIGVTMQDLTISAGSLW